METIKTSPNMEFDVIYADGTRKRVPEGVLYEAAADGSIIFHNGTERPAVMLAATETALVALSQMGPGLLALAMGMAISGDSRAVMREFATCASESLENRSAQDQAVFRLGQMDMRESASAMLRNIASGTSGVIAATLRLAADAVDALEVS